jgi:hypothetical protein
MDKDKPDLFDEIEGLTPVGPDTLEQFKREMIENVIPDIVRIVEQRRMLAAESRHRKLEVVAHKRKPTKD